MKSCSNCKDFRKQKKVHFNICVSPKSEFFKVPLPHGKDRKACRSWRSRLPTYPLIPQTVPEGMRFIEDLRAGEFQDSEFWIIGTDPNLDLYPDDFFEGKFSITLNAACYAFPGSTFFLTSGARVLQRMTSIQPGCLTKFILALGFLPKPRPNAIGYWEDWGLDPIWMRLEARHQPAGAPDFESTAQRIFGEGPYEFAWCRTVAHLAIFAAIVLGARKIILVGCAHKILGTQGHATGRGLANHYPSAPVLSAGPRADRMERDLRVLTEVFGRYGIEIVRHLPDENRKGFIFEKIESPEADIRLYMEGKI